ncbi:hypothetical protein, partial [Anaplasma platys]|uniref:hypothetical protein n=1 Tax=Anaplasma platys TaxID=949 RepID=UPI001F2E4037
MFGKPTQSNANISTLESGSPNRGHIANLLCALARTAFSAWIERLVGETRELQESFNVGIVG